MFTKGTMLVLAVTVGIIVAQPQPVAAQDGNGGICIEIDLPLAAVRPFLPDDIPKDGEKVSKDGVELTYGNPWLTIREGAVHLDVGWSRKLEAFGFMISAKGTARSVIDMKYSDGRWILSIPDHRVTVTQVDLKAPLGIPLLPFSPIPSPTKLAAHEVVAAIVKDLITEQVAEITKSLNVETDKFINASPTLKAHKLFISITLSGEKICIRNRPIWVARAIASNGRIFTLGTDGSLYASGPNQPPILQARNVKSFALDSGNRIFYLDTKGDLYAFSEGKEIVKQNNNGVSVKAFAVGPNNRVFFLGSDQKNLYAFSEGKPIIYQAGAVESFALGENGRIFYLDLKGNLHAFSEGKGIIQQTKDIVVKTFAVGPNNRVFFLGSDQKNLYAFSEGKPIIYQAGAVESFALGENGRIFYLDLKGDLHAFSEGKGIVKQNKNGVSVKAFAVGANNRIFFLGSDQKNLYAFTEDKEIVYQAGAVKSFALSASGRIFYLDLNNNVRTFCEGESIFEVFSGWERIREAADHGIAGLAARTQTATNDSPRPHPKK